MFTNKPPIVSGVNIKDKLVPSHFDSFLSISVGVFFVSSENKSSKIGSYKIKFEVKIYKYLFIINSYT